MRRGRGPRAIVLLRRPTWLCGSTPVVPYRQKAWPTANSRRKFRYDSRCRLRTGHLAAAHHNACTPARLLQDQGAGLRCRACANSSRQRLARNLVSLPNVNLTFEVADLLDRLPERRFVDVTLCLYSILSHLPISELPKVVAEFGRVTRGYFITTVRSVGSTPCVRRFDRSRETFQARPSSGSVRGRV